MKTRYNLVPILLLFISLLFVYENSYSNNYVKDLEVITSKSVVIDIDEGDILRDEIPIELFSFNINYISLQKGMWDKKTGALNSKILESLKKFSGSTFRYPGGIVANNVDWSGIVGPVNKRNPQKSLYHRKPEPISFGIDEYLELVDALPGKPWYVLNLLGINALNPLRESDKKVVAKHNQDLAKYLKPKLKTTPHYYQLGNELDRSKYEWSPEKYVIRSRETIEAILEVDEKARFVAFLRDFPWKYRKDPERGTSQSYDLMNTILNGLPMVSDYSLHHYYDGNRSDGKSWTIPFWIRHMDKSINDFKKIRNGKAPNIWITEHARQKTSNKPNRDGTRFYVSNLSGSISTADYLITLLQIPEVKGAFVHGLNSGPWQIFDYSIKHNDLRPTPLFKTLLLLKNTRQGAVLKTKTASPNTSKYKGGYDVRAVGIWNENNDQLMIWVINRANKSHNAAVNFSPYLGRNVNIQHRYIAGLEGVDADDRGLEPKLNFNNSIKTGKFTKDGQLSIELPPSSISNILLSTKPIE